MDAIQATAQTNMQLEGLDKETAMRYFEKAAKSKEPITELCHLIGLALGKACGYEYMPYGETTEQSCGARFEQELFKLMLS